MLGPQILSAELVLQIFSLLHSTDIPSVCLVSRLWRALSERLLYTTISLAAGGADPSPLDCFLRTIVSRPELGTHVRAVSVEWQTPSLAGPVVPISNLLHVQLGQLHYFLPALQTLEIIPPFQLPLRDPFAAAAMGDSSAFPSLRQLTWHQHGGNSGISPTQLLSLLTLPSLRRITVHMAHGPGMDCLDPVLLGAHLRSSAITHLTLQHGNMTACALAHILRLPRALTHFTYSDSHANPLGNLDLRSFRLALLVVRDTLQYLRLGFCSALEDDNEWPAYRGLGSLREWPALQSIGCTMMALLGRSEGAVECLGDVVPAVVREVILVSGWGDWSSEELARQIAMMVGRSGGSALQWLEVMTLERGIIGEEMEDGLRAVCEEAGVSLVIGC